MIQIPFNKPHLTGKETIYIQEAVASGKISGNGLFTQKCQDFFRERYNFRKCLLTTSCTDALEMAAILLDIRPGDEVIIPSYTFVSSANAFVLRGAKIVFADSRNDHPGIDETKIEKLITEKTRAIVPVHYAGFACDMDKIMEIAARHNLFVVEDAAQAIESFYLSNNNSRKPVGSVGHMAAFSFHETKNIISGEGGMLVINDPRFEKRAEIIWEKGTNRAAFYRGEVDKYGWVDIGSSFLPSEIIAAFLWAQLEHIDDIQSKRLSIWKYYFENLKQWAAFNGIALPVIPASATNNGHMFYMVCGNLEQRTKIINTLKDNHILSVFHYQSLHKSQFYENLTDNCHLPQADRYTDCLMRLPLFYDLTDNQLEQVCITIRSINPK